MFTSTMENTMQFTNGVMSIVPKKFPNWYGIEGIGFVYHGDWADPEIEYKGKRCSCYIVEDTMWERFREEYGSEDEYLFTIYMLEHVDEVYELCELALFGEI